MPPSVLFSEGDGAWTPKDRLIAVALTLHEASLCSGCGQSMLATWDTGAEVEVKEHTCAGCKAREEHVHAKQDGLGAGVKVGVSKVTTNEWNPEDEVMPVFD